MSRASHSTTTTILGSKLRFAFCAVVVVLLSTWVASSAAPGLGGDPQPGPAPEIAAQAAEVDEAAELRRFEAVAERTDRKLREAERAEAEAEQQRTGRAEPPRPSPEPEPEPEPEPQPEPEPEPEGDQDAGPVPDSCGSYSGNRATGCTLLLDAGFGLDQMSCLDNLWTKESGWDHTAQNPSSGAYGIPQALPGDKMATAGSDWQTNPVTQITWGLGYIENRYGTPCSAWQHSQNNNWY